MGDVGVGRETLYEVERPSPACPCVVTVGLVVGTEFARLGPLPPVVDTAEGCGGDVVEIAEGVGACSSASSVYAGGGGSSSLMSATSCQDPVVAGVAAPVDTGAGDDCGAGACVGFGTYPAVEPLLPLPEVAGPCFRLPQ